MHWCLILMALNGADPALESGVPKLESIFLQRQHKAWRQLMPAKGRVRLDLRPILNDFGYLSPDQVAMGFDKLMTRYTVQSVKITNSQSDTNYGWLDIYLEAQLMDRRNGMTYSVTFSIQFKITAARWAVSQWVIQDVF